MVEGFVEGKTLGSTTDSYQELASLYARGRAYVTANAPLRQELASLYARERAYVTANAPLRATPP